MLKPDTFPYSNSRGAIGEGVFGFEESIVVGVSLPEGIEVRGVELNGKHRWATYAITVARPNKDSRHDVKTPMPSRQLCDACV